MPEASDSARMATALPTSTSQAAVMPRSFISLSSTQGEMPSCDCSSIQQRSAMASMPYSATTWSSTTPSRTTASNDASGTPFHEVYVRSTSALPLTAASPAESDFIRARMSERSSVSTVIPWRCSATSSMRTVLNGVVRAPMAPTTMPFTPFATRQTRSKCSTFFRKASPDGAAVWGLSAVNFTPYWQNTSMMENLPQKASRRTSGCIWSRSSG